MPDDANLVFFKMFEVLDKIRERIDPYPANIALILKEMKFVLRINIQKPGGGLIGYDLEMSYFDTLRIHNIEKVVDYCVMSANEFFKQVV